jgi:hypothetical protein
MWQFEHSETTRATPERDVAAGLPAAMRALARLAEQ